MTTTTYHVEFPGGTTATRTTEATYPYASYLRGKVRFHKTHEAAVRTGGTVRPTEVLATTAPKVEAFVVLPGETCTVTVTATGGTCGKPGVTGFYGRGFGGGEGTAPRRYVECAEHAM